MSKLVAPSILAADFANLEKEIKAVTAAGADWLHVDVMDGHFVNNITIGVPVVASLKKVCSIPLDVHLMIEKPEKYVKPFIEAGADYLTIHIESTADPAAVLLEIKNLGAKPGMTLRPGTRIEKIVPFLGLVDLVLVMTVEPGFGGQKFMADQIAKIDFLKAHRAQNNLKYLIEVDGGINQETARQCPNADVFVAGNYIFRSGNYTEAVKSLKF